MVLHIEFLQLQTMIDSEEEKLKLKLEELKRENPDDEYLMDFIVVNPNALINTGLIQLRDHYVPLSLEMPPGTKVVSNYLHTNSERDYFDLLVFLNTLVDHYLAHHQKNLYEKYKSIISLFTSTLREED